MILAPRRMHGQGIMRSLFLQNLGPFTLTGSTIFHFSPWKVGNELSVNRNFFKILFFFFWLSFYKKNCSKLVPQPFVLTLSMGKMLPSSSTGPLPHPHLLFSVLTRQKKENVRCKFWKAALRKLHKDVWLSVLHNRPPFPHSHGSSYFRLILIFSCFYYF